MEIFLVVPIQIRGNIPGHFGHSAIPERGCGRDTREAPSRSTEARNSNKLRPALSSGLPKLGRSRPSGSCRFSASRYLPARVLSPSESLASSKPLPPVQFLIRKLFGRPQICKSFTCRYVDAKAISRSLGGPVRQNRRTLFANCSHRSI